MYTHLYIYIHYYNHLCFIHLILSGDEKLHLYMFFVFVVSKVVVIDIPLISFYISFSLSLISLFICSVDPKCVSLSLIHTHFIYIYLYVYLDITIHGYNVHELYYYVVYMLLLIHIHI